MSESADLNKQESNAPEIDISQIQAFHLDDFAGSSICSPFSSDPLADIFNDGVKVDLSRKISAEGHFFTKSGSEFTFSFKSNAGGVQGNGALDGIDDIFHLRYNINSVAFKEGHLVYHGIITKSKNLPHHFKEGNSIIFKLNIDRSNIDTDQYNAAIYGLSPALELPYYESEAWLSCGEECFPANFYLNVTDGNITVNIEDQ